LGAAGLALSILERKSVVRIGVAPAPKLEFASIAFKRSMACRIEGNSSMKIPVMVCKFKARWRAHTYVLRPHLILGISIVVVL
jgi:hypothetical protein